MDKALEDRRLILEGLAQRFTQKKLSERKNPDGSLTYQDFLDRMELKKNEVISVRIINRPQSG